MLAVTETALPGAALTIPGVAVRDARPYLAIRAAGPMRDLPQFAPPKFAALHDWMREHGVVPGEGFFRYRRFGEGGEVELEVGTFIHSASQGGGEVLLGEIPAGRYAAATCIGPYDRLYDAFAMLDGWIAARGLAAAGRPGEPECHAEIYRVSPAQTGDPLKWETDLLIKLAD